MNIGVPHRITQLEVPVRFCLQNLTARKLAVSDLLERMERKEK